MELYLGHSNETRFELGRQIPPNKMHRTPNSQHTHTHARIQHCCCLAVGRKYLEQHKAIWNWLAGICPIICVVVVIATICQAQCEEKSMKYVTFIADFPYCNCVPLSSLSLSLFKFASCTELLRFEWNAFVHLFLSQHSIVFLQTNYSTCYVRVYLSFALCLCSMCIVPYAWYAIVFVQTYTHTHSVHRAADFQDPFILKTFASCLLLLVPIPFSSLFLCASHQTYSYTRTLPHIMNSIHLMI